MKTDGVDRLGTNADLGPVRFWVQTPNETDPLHRDQARCRLVSAVPDDRQGLRQGVARSSHRHAQRRWRASRTRGTSRPRSRRWRRDGVSSPAMSSGSTRAPTAGVSGALSVGRMASRSPSAKPSASTPSSTASPATTATPGCSTSRETGSCCGASSSRAPTPSGSRRSPARGRRTPAQGVFCEGAHNAYINLIVHDTQEGFSIWGNPEEGAGGEIYGCLIYNNGWRGPDRGHGHGIYAQNAVGTKRVVDNILFNQFGYGIHCYGSEKASLKGFHIEGNASFNNGSLAGSGKRSFDIFVGGGSGIDRLAVFENFTYGGGGLQVGYASDVRNRGIVVKNNLIAGGARFTALESGVFTGNALVAPGTLVNFDRGTIGTSASLNGIDNTYRRTKVEWAPFNLGESNRAAGLSFIEWQRRTGLDAGSRYRESPAQGVKVIVRPNRYEPGRAHVIVYNWDKKGAVEVDLRHVLGLGQPYRIVSVQDVHGDEVARSTYDGKPIVLPMKPGRPSPPIGMSAYPVPVTEPEFGAFVVLATRRTIDTWQGVAWTIRLNWAHSA